MKEKNVQKIPTEVLLPIGIKTGRDREGSWLRGYGARTRLVGCFENIQNQLNTYIFAYWRLKKHDPPMVCFGFCCFHFYFILCTNVSPAVYICIKHVLGAQENLKAFL